MLTPLDRTTDLGLERLNEQTRDLIGEKLAVGCGFSHDEMSFQTTE